MQITITRDSFKKALAIANRAIGKSSLPVLSNVLLAVDGPRLKVVATNLELGLTVWVDATITEPGTITVPAKLLSDIVGSLPNEPITLTHDQRGHSLHLTCAGFDTTIKGIDADEFPVMPTITSAASVRLPAAVLRSIIAQVAPAAATDTTRPVLTGVLVRIRTTEATFVAADGLRLAQRTITLDEPASMPFEQIIPASTMTELGIILSDRTDLVELILAPSASQILFRSDSLEVVSRLIDGKYPDVQRIIPTSCKSRIELDRAALAKAVKLASFIATQSSNITRLAWQPGGGDAPPAHLQISANAAECGDNAGTLEPLQLRGDGGTIALNVHFLAEAIASIDTPTIALEWQSPQSPAVFTPVGGSGFVHLVMPMTVHEH